MINEINIYKVRFMIFAYILSIFICVTMVEIEYVWSQSTPRSTVTNNPSGKINKQSQANGWYRKTSEYLPHEIMGTGGMVTADHALASQAGVEILRQGGDAVDAAVTTALVLGVLQPFASGIGGGGFAVIYRRQSKQVKAWDFRETAPTKAHAKMYVNQTGEVIKGSSTVGPLAVAVPGEIAGLYALHKKYGRLPWKTVVKPARILAQEGFAMHKLLYDYIELYKDRVLNCHGYPALLLDDKKQAKPLGTRIKFPQLAHTLQQIEEQGAQAFYQGKIAQEIVRSVQKAGGIISLSDLKNYQIKYREALHTNYQGYQLYTMPPPSSGGLVIIQILKVLAQTDFATLAHNSGAYLHRLTESLKHAFADRANHMGDPDFYPIPIKQILSDQRIKQIIGHFQSKRTQDIKSYGGRFQATRDGGTSHFNVLDAQGNAVALTTTINTTFASQFIAGSTGILLNNEMDDFITKPGVPNAYGLIGHVSNEVQAHKRPLSSMSPTLILKNHQIKGMVGGSGGPTIITGTLQVLLNLLHQDGPSGHVGQSVARPRIHHQWMPNVLKYDQNMKQEPLQLLREYGHKIKVWPSRFTAIQALWVEGQKMMGASDPSKQGKPSVVDVLSP